MFSHLDVPTTYQNLTSMKISIPTNRFFDTTIDDDYWTLGKPTHTLVPCWMPKTLASKEPVYG